MSASTSTPDRDAPPSRGQRGKIVEPPPERLEFVELTPPPASEADQDKDFVNISLMWLHGLGADGYDLYGLAEHMKLPQHVRARHLLPHAPMRAVTLNGGVSMRAWYDMGAVPPRFNDNYTDITEGVERLADILKEEKSTSRYVIGFSQGGVMALQLALKYRELVDGVIALSCYLAETDILKTVQPGYVYPPTFLGHGKFDDVIPISCLDDVIAGIRPHCGDLVVRRYRAGHSISADTLHDIQLWLDARL